MEEQTTFSNVSKMSTTTIAVQHQVMIEKWMLVLLIVGCTSLVFLICFPIDFYLYRRRRRLARERKNLTMYRPQTQSNRAAQIHAKVTVAEVAAEVDFEEMNRKDRKVYRAQRGIMRFLSLIRKKSNKKTLVQHAKDFKSENSSECRVLTTPETSNTIAHIDKKIHNDQSTAMHSQDFGETTRENKASAEALVSPDDKFLERGLVQGFSNELNAWGENKDSVSRNEEQLRYGAFKPPDYMTITNDSTSFSIPVRNINTVFVKPGNDSEGDIVNQDRHGSHQDIIVESETAYEQSAVIKGMSSVDERLQGRQSVGCRSDTHLEDENRKTYTPIQEFKNSDTETECQRQEYLIHSNSDHCISYNSKHSKHRKRGNIITPTNKLASSTSEKFCIEDKQNSSLSYKRTLSLSTTLEEPSLASNTKRKKKKESFLKKQPSDSMPELQHYQKEKF